MKWLRRPFKGHLLKSQYEVSPPPVYTFYTLRPSVRAAFVSQPSQDILEIVMYDVYLFIFCSKIGKTENCQQDVMGPSFSSDNSDIYNQQIEGLMFFFPFFFFIFFC